MSSIRDHYENLLGPHYTEMAGGFEAVLAREAARFDALGIGATRTGRALDLGCGSGFQSVALARRGFAVTAIDLSPRLLAELDTRASGLAIRTIEGDIGDAASLVGAGATFDLVVCMGDTLTHLEHPDDVSRLCATIAGLLAPGGRTVLTFRDLTATRTGTDRFLPLKLSDDLMMTCMLEYHPQVIIVHDLIHVKTGDIWRFAASAYRKLRLNVDDVCAALEAAELGVTHAANEDGFVTLDAGRT